MPMIHEIGLDYILPDPENPRSGELTDIEALAANIDAVGLLNPINVREIGPIAPADGHDYDVPGYMIVAGHRRYEAAKQLKWKTIPCTIVKAESPTELALTENIMRQAMHPVDEHRAFVKLKLDGYSVKKIAKHFGVNERTVKQRLALGSIIPEFLELWRGNKIEWDSIKQLAQMKPGKQKEALAKVQEWQMKRNSDEEIPEWVIDQLVTHKRTYLESDKVRFVGLEDYKAAGGRIDEDLFGDEQWIADTDLLASLYDRKKIEVLEQWRAQGWRSVQFVTSTPSRWEKQLMVHDTESLEDEEKAAIDVDLMIHFDGSVKPTRWKDRPEKKEEVYNAGYSNGRASYGDAPKPGDSAYDWEVKVKMAAIAKLMELRRTIPNGAAAEYLIEQIKAIEPPRKEDLPEPARVPVDDDPPETEPADEPPQERGPVWGDDEHELVTEEQLAAEDDPPAPEENGYDQAFAADLDEAVRAHVRQHLDGLPPDQVEEIRRVGVPLSTEEVVAGVQYQLAKSGVHPAFNPPPSYFDGSPDEGEEEWDPPAGEGEQVSPGDEGDDHDTEQGAADRPARKRSRGTKAERGRSRRKLQPRNVGQVA